MELNLAMFISSNRRRSSAKMVARAHGRRDQSCIWRCQKSAAVDVPFLDIVGINWLKRARKSNQKKK
ncbi:hypothetical protein DASB73_035130 [Starmerella bacillaris]|uniref:Uncharacterized protein n=1 Tax=Starmerella bacillaris TaxID=1247836 RepID=A0AAV5RM95_STABA|nr:hypothetical protein DASB73_035130 [Starmerella bacillaris]